jgi:hypothetical protein
MIVLTQLALKTHTNFGCAVSLATLEKLVDRFPLPPVAPPIGDTSLIHVMRLAPHSLQVTNAYSDDLRHSSAARDTKSSSGVITIIYDYGEKWINKFQTN